MANNKMSLSKKNFAKFKEVVGYSEPFPCICSADFVCHVQMNSDKTVSQALEELLGGRVQLFSTRCIKIAVHGMYGEPNKYHFASTKPCLHTPEKPEYDTDKCVKDFVREYLGHRLIVCSTNREDYAFYTSIPGRILVIPAGRDCRLGRIQIAPLARFQLRQPQPQFQIMEENIKIFRLWSPLLTICEPGFVRHVQQNSVLTSTLQSLLGGSISLVSTLCIYDEMKQWKLDTSEFQDTVMNCGHGGQLLTGAACMKLYVKTRPLNAHVVCTVEEREHYVKVPNKIVVIPNGVGGISIDNTLSPSLFAKIKEVVGYSEPFPCICSADFVLHVQKNSRKTVSEALEELLGGRVRLFSTMCINIAVHGNYGERNKYQSASTVPCLHTRDRPELDTDECVKDFVKSYFGHRLIVCSTKREDYAFYLSIPGRILVIPDGRDWRLGRIKIAPVARLSLMQPQPQFRIMEEYMEIFRLRAPLLTICEPHFVKYVQENSVLTSSLQSLLGGSISLISTTCIHNQMHELNLDTSEFQYTVQNCGHTVQLTGAACMKHYAKTYFQSPLAVCTMEEREHYAKVPSNIVVIPNGRGGISIYSQATDSWFRYARHNLNVNKMLSILKKMLLDCLVHHNISSEMIYLYGQPVSFMVCSEDGEKFGPFTSVVVAANKMIEISGANLADDGFDCELSVDEMEDNPIVDISVKKAIPCERKRVLKRKLCSLEGDTENPGSEATGSKKIEIGGKSKRAICFQDAEMDVEDSAEPASKKSKKKKLKSKSTEHEPAGGDAVKLKPKKKKRSLHGTEKNKRNKLEDLPNEGKKRKKKKLAE